MYFRGAVIQTPNATMHEIITTPSANYIRYLRENTPYIASDYYMYYLIILFIALGCIKLMMTIADDTVAFRKKYTPHITPIQITTPIDYIPPLNSSISSAIQMNETTTPIININYGDHTILHSIRTMNSKINHIRD